MEETLGERVLVCGNPWGSVPSKLDPHSCTIKPSPVAAREHFEKTHQ
jgi:hypothetical protein